MTIYGSLSQSKLTLKILNGPQWEGDLAQVKALPERRWNKDIKLWEVPWYLTPEVSKLCGDRLLLEPAAEKLLGQVRPRTLLAESAPNLLPMEFSRCLKTYQERYVRLSKDRNRLLCACEMGTGKTVSALERVKALGYLRLCIVCPKAVCTNWRTEVEKVLGQEALVYQGTAPKRAGKLLEVCLGSQPVIATYETFGELINAFKDGILGTFDQLIFDEAHLMSNPTSKRFKTAQEFMLQHPDNIGLQLLTGTPMQHRVRDIWALFHLLDPLGAGSFTAFKEKYEEPTRWMDKKLEVAPGKWVSKRIAIAWKPVNLHLLREELDTQMFRVRREDVTTFRDAMEPITVELTLAQRRLYDKVRSQILLELDNRDLNLRHVPVRLLRLLQAAEGAFNLDPKREDSGKLEYIKELLDSTDKKVIVWSRFKPITEILGRLYADRCVVYNGDRSDNYKDLAKWCFNGVETEKDAEHFSELRSKVKPLGGFEPGGAQFFFGTLDMRSCLGMNLHSDCYTQVFSSFSWLGAVNAQAADRLRRIGQKSEYVSTSFLISEDTFEAAALELIMSNFQNTIEAIDGKEKMSYKQIEQIVEVLREEKTKNWR